MEKNSIVEEGSYDMAVYENVIYWAFVMFFLGGLCGGLMQLCGVSKGGENKQKSKNKRRISESDRVLYSTVLRLKQLYDTLKIHTEIENMQRNGSSSNFLQRRDALKEIVQFFDEMVQRLHSLSNEQKNQLQLLVNDAEKILDVTPITYFVQYSSPVECIVKKFKVHGFFEEDFCEPWFKKLGEFEENIKTFKKILKLDVESKAEKVATLQLESSALKEATNTAVGVLSTISTEKMQPEDVEALNRTVEVYDHLPVIEAERAKRILSNVSQAQQLGEKAVEKNITINGETPEEVVQRIVSGNMQELHEQVLYSAKNEDHDMLSVQHDLQLLDVYTKNLREKQ